jgi:hypothetical protein
VLIYLENSGGGGGGGNAESDYLRCTNFGFVIPTGSTITGIEVEIDQYASVSDSVHDYLIRLRNATGQKGDDKAKTSYWADADSDSYVLYGGVSDLWGEFWTAAEINNGDFGVDIIAESTTSSIANIDHIRIKIFYTEPDSQEQDNGIIRPDEDVSAQWEESEALDHFELINDNVVDPTTPSTSSDYIYTISTGVGNHSIPLQE